MREENNSECLLCGYKGDGRVISKLAHYEARRCPGCSIVYIYPKLNHDELAKLHSSEEYFEHPYFEKRRGMAAAIEKSHEKLLQRISPCGPYQKILEIGCSTGELMFFLRRRLGCECHGVDVSGMAVNGIEKAEGVFPLCADIREAPYEDGYFDLVIMVDVIEHVDDPPAVMRRVNQLLRPGGAVYIQTLNQDSLIYSWSIAVASVLPQARGFIEKIYPPFHPYYFDKKTLGDFIVRSGFAPVAAFDEEPDIATVGYEGIMRMGIRAAYLLQAATGRRSLQSLLAVKDREI